MLDGVPSQYSHLTQSRVFRTSYHEPGLIRESLTINNTTTNYEVKETRVVCGGGTHP